MKSVALISRQILHLDWNDTAGRVAYRYEISSGLVVDRKLPRRDMNGTDGAGGAARVVTARLPSGAPVRVEVRGSDSDDEMTSVGLRDLDMDGALNAVAEIGSVVVGKLRAIRPAKATVEMKLGFAVEAGKLTALWVGGKGEASLKVTLEWSGHDAASGGEDD